MSSSKIARYGAIGFILNASFYLLTEFIAALGTGYPLDYVYARQFISALGVYNGQVVEGVPENFSSWAIVMNIGFIVTALGFVASYLLLIFPKMKKVSKARAYILLLIVLSFGVGSLLVGLYQGGVPGQDDLHGLGARLSFLMGNATLLLTGIFLPEKRLGYRSISIILAIVGFSAVYFLQNAITANLENVMAIYERLTVYPITAWQFITGITFLTKRNK
ncbi:MAG: DUF998 domain-containing protein [Gemella sp.]|nr:DUF998 domain-containing protein [Gemella sp.]